MPKGVLDGAFLGTQAPELTIKPNKTVRTRVIHAVHRSVGARYVAVMAPHDEGDGRQLTIPECGKGEVAEIASDAGVDIVAGAVDSERTAGRLITDAHAAVVSLRRGRKGKLRLCSFAMMHGRFLSFDGQTLVEVARSAHVNAFDAEGEAMTRSLPAAHVADDGKRLVVRGPGGVSVSCLRLTAREVTCNGKERKLPDRGETVAVQIPRLPREWSTSISEDGRQVDVTGDGPQPLKIHAPKAVNVTVNGVNRWFVRDGQGNIFPALEYGSPFRYEGEQGAAQLQKALTDESDAVLADRTSFRPEARSGPVLASPSGRIDLDLQTPGPGVYKVVVNVIGSERITASVATASGTQSVAGTAQTPPTGQSLCLTGLNLSSSVVRLSIRSSKRVGLASVRLEPGYRRLPANLWMTIGPFPSDFLKDGSHGEADVERALATAYPPEKELNFDATCEGSNGQQLRWQHSDSTDGPVMLDGVNLKIRCGVKRSGICYAATFIISPDARPAQIRVSCDYWANLYLNGRLVRSTRSESSIAKDGAQFKGTTRIAATLHLRKGINHLLAKVQGGSGGSSFTAAITDPGDLGIAPRP